MEKKLKGTLYVHCDESSIKSVVREVKRLHPEAMGGKIMKGFRFHNSEVIMRVRVSDEKELSTLGKALFTSLRGVKAIQPTIELRASTTG